MSEAKQEALLMLRSGCGTWIKERGQSITILDRNVTPQIDLRGYEIIELRKAYTKPLNYNITATEAQAKIKSLKQIGYMLQAPQFPELQEHFRNGSPITAIDIFHDALKEIDTEALDNDLTGLEYLMKHWNNS